MKRSEMIDLIFDVVKQEADKASWNNRDRTLLTGGYDGEVSVERDLADLILTKMEERGMLPPNVYHNGCGDFEECTADHVYDCHWESEDEAK